MKRFFATLILVLVLVAVASAPAWAHKVVAGAYASGDHIEGEIGFSDGTMAKNAVVEVLAEDGTKLGEVKTGEDGTFTFTPTQRIVHIFHSDLGGGHIANIRMEVADLPAMMAAVPSIAGGAMAPATAAGTSAGTASGAVTDAQKAALADAVANEMRPLRREIIAMKEKNDMQSILGGIGYIVGLFGIGFYVAGWYRYRKA